MANSILVIIDPTAKEQPALARAAWLAEQLDTDLELFICDYDQYLAGERFFDSKALKKARAGLLERHAKKLHELAKPYSSKGVRIAVDTAWDHPLHEGILRKIEAAQPTLVVKDTHYHSAIRRSVFSNTDWNLIRDCPRPLWLVKPHTKLDIGTVAAAVDPVHERDKPASLDHKILETARDLCTVTDAELHVVHAFDPAPVYAVSTDAMSFPIAEPINEVIAGLRAEHKKAMDELLSKQDIAGDHVHVVEGETREVLCGIVDELSADLLVIGAVARGVLQRLVLGSTAERVLDFIPCDLLIVKPDPVGNSD